MSSKFLTWALTLVTAVAVSACGGGGSNGPAAPAVGGQTGGSGAGDLYTLEATVTGAGTVASQTGTLTCASSGTSKKCSDTVAAATDVTLTAAASSGYSFSGWSGSCTGKGTCKVKMSSAQSVTAVFVPDPVVAMTVTGSGTIASLPSGLSCDGAASPCSTSITAGTAYTLTATPATGFVFAGWSGDCTGSSTCSLTVDAAKSLTATFVPATQGLTVALTGSGSVALSPAGLNCASATCTYTLTEGSTQTLTATPSTGYVFSGWGGACAGTGTCAVTLSGAKAVTATFTPVQLLTLTVAGSGNVSSNPAGLDCAGSCSANLTAGGAYVLTASPASGYVFTGWGGVCSGTGTCSVTMSAAKAVTATFAPNQLLTMDVSGSGSISSSPSGLSCFDATAPCTASLLAGSTYVLTATPTSGYSFTGWSGACTGTGTCSVTMSTAKSVTANFTGNQTLSLAVTGSGTIVSSPTGKGCATASCSYSLTTGSAYTFTATAATGYTFTGWSGGVCTGTSPCAVTMNAAKTLTATFTANQTLNLAVVGSGSIASSPSGYSCSNSTTPCVASLTQGTALTLTATPATGYTFTGWSGGTCTGTGTCAVTMSAAKSVTATFTANQALNLAVVGSGSIASSPTGYNCSNSTTPCVASLTQGTALTLTATPATGYTFTGWSGGTCTGTGTCAVTMSTATSVTATFAANQALNLAVVGSGAIASSPAGYNCSNTTTPCTASLSQGASLTLTATAATGYTFAGWSGACTGSGTCAVTLSTAQSVTATFTANQTLSLAVVGSGSIASTPSGYNCANTTTPCTASLTQGTALTLTATPATGYTFTGWSGGTCTGTGTCAVTMSAAKSVTATFALSNQTLNLTLAGSGTVSSAPAGVSCTTTCAPSLSGGTAYTLTAAPATGYTFTGWSGAAGCTGTGSCVVTMSAAQAVTATFTANQTLSLSITGTGSVSSAPAGVSCASTASPCSSSLTSGAAYTLTATPATGYTFTGWGGACTGTGTCAVTMSAAKSVTATFAATTQTLSLTMAGSGTVSSSPAGVSCTATCAPALTTGTAYTLTATPATGYTFTGWSGTAGCTGTGTCAVTMSAAKAVTATFTANQTLNLSITGSGSVSSNPSGVSCASTASPCAPSLTGGAAYTLTATPSSGYTFTGWGGACTGTGTCAVTMSAAKSVTATFAVAPQTLSLTMVGSGNVSSSPAGVNCAASCSNNLTSGSTYTLTAVPSSGYTFSGWSGACSGTSTCAVTMSAAQSVTATFAATSGSTQTLSVAISGSGSVVSSGIVTCTTATCSTGVQTGASFKLQATPATGYKFSGWTGACTGTSSSCALTMNAAKSVTAAFVPDLSAVGCTITPGSPTATPTLAASHPKLFFNHTQTANCLKALATANDPTFKRLKDFVDVEVASGANRDLAQYGFETWFAALVYRVTGDTKYRDFAVARTDYFVASELALAAAGGTAQPEAAKGWYLYAGYYLGGVAIVYDWCFDGVNATQRDNWISYMNQGVYNLWNETTASWGGHLYQWPGWANTDPYNNYYYSFLQATMLVGVATDGENPKAAEWRTKFRTAKIDGEVVPMFNSRLYHGGSLEGTNYGVSMKTLFWTYDWWERSTGQRIADLTPHTLGSMAWMLHQTVPNTTYLVNLGDQSRDAHAWFFDYNRQYLLQLMSLYPQEKMSGVSSLMLAGSTLPQMSYSWMSAWDFILKPPALPATKITDLNTTWYGTGVGEIYMRSAWGDPTAVLGMFKCGWFTESHQHYDQGSFQIYRGSWLSPVGNFFSNSGLEGAVESQSNVWFGDPATGGTAIQQTTRLGGTGDCTMSAVADNSNYTYGSGDITALYYSNPNIAKHQREFVFIKPNTFVVFDRAVSTASNVKRVWSIVVPTTPTVSGNQLTYTTPDANRMDVYQVAPAGLGINVVPFEWQSWGLNTAYSSNPPKRADVVDTNGTTSYFLNVISTSSNAAASSVSSVSALSKTGQTGVQVNLADGRVAYLYFNNTSTGGTINIKDASGADVLGTTASPSALPTGITVPPIFAP